MADVVHNSKAIFNHKNSSFIVLMTSSSHFVQIAYTKTYLFAYHIEHFYPMPKQCVVPGCRNIFVYQYRVLVESVVEKYEHTIALLCFVFCLLGNIFVFRTFKRR